MCLMPRLRLAVLIRVLFRLHPEGLGPFRESGEHRGGVPLAQPCRAGLCISSISRCHASRSLEAPSLLPDFLQQLSEYRRFLKSCQHPTHPS